MNELWFPFLFAAVVAVVLVFVLYRFFRYGGLIGLMYGKRHETLGEVELSMRFGSGKVILYRLEPEGISMDQEFVLEFRTRIGTSWQAMPFRISREKAGELMGLLSKAAR